VVNIKNWSVFSVEVTVIVGISDQIITPHFILIDGRVILKWILGKLGLGCGLESSGSGQGPLASSCEQGNEPSGSVKGG
jgi:hypothetical protein